jgi:type II secretory pathway pseudopilin PulG
MTRTSMERTSRDDRSAIFSSMGMGDRGDTLIEVLMALLVLSICALALIIAFTTSISASAEHRDIATAHIVLASYSQQALAQIEQNQALFACAAANQAGETAYVLSSVQNKITIPPNYGNYSATVSDVEYWNATLGAFETQCTPGSNVNPPLRVTITVTGPGGPYYNVFVVDLPSGNLGAANDLSNGTISQLVFTSPLGSGASGTSGVPFSPQPVVSALDSSSEPVVESYPQISLSIESGPGPATISGYSTTPSNGISTFSGATITALKAGTYVVEASWNGITSDPLNAAPLNENTYNPYLSPFWQTSPNWYTTTFTVVVAGAQDQVVFTKTPQAGASGATLNQQPVIQVQSSPGVQDQNQNGSVTLQLSGGELTGCKVNNVAVTTTPDDETLTVPITKGSATLTGCQFSGATFYNATASPAGPDPTTYSITATYPNASSASSQIAVTGPGAVNQLVFVTQPSGVSNAANSAAPWPQPFAVEVEDSFHNPVWTVNAAQVSVAFATNVDTLSHCTESTVNDSAIATFTGCEGKANDFAGGLQLKASYGTNPNIITALSQPFSISADAKTLVFSTQPVAGQSGATMATQPVVEILDGSGNVDSGWSTNITLAVSGGALTDCTGQTPNNGYATIAACLFSGNPGSPYTMTASLTNSEGQIISVTSAPFSPSQAGTATQLQFTTQPVAGAVAGSLMTTQPVIKIEDSQGNVVTSSSATISSLTSSGGTLAGCTNLTAVLGVVNVSNCTFGGLIGSYYTLIAKSPGLTTAVSALFASNTQAGPEAGVLISANPTSVPASSATNAQLNFQVVDIWGNPTVSTGDTVLTISSSSTGGFFGTTLGQVGAPGTSSTVTIPSGAATATAFYGDEVVGAPTITAFDPGTPQAFGSASLNITPNAATQLVYSTPPPTTITAGTKFTVSVTEEDQFNNVVSTDSTSTVTLTGTNGTSNGGFSCLSTSTVVTSGVATFFNCSYTSSSTNPYILTAASTGLTSATASTTVSTGPASQVIVWSGNNQSAKTNTAFAAPLSVLVTDASGNPVAGVTVTFTSPTNGATGRFAANTTGSACLASGTARTSCTAVTNASGIATSLSFSATGTAGTYNVTASITGGTSATFSETNANPVLVFLTSQQSFSTTTTSANTTSGSMVVQAQDSFGNPIIQTTPLTVTLVYNKTGTFTLTTDPTTVTIPAGSSSVAFVVAASTATGTATFTIGASATGYTGATLPTETVKANATPPTATVVVTPAQTVTSAAPNAIFPVAITNSTNGSLYYSVVAVNGLMAGETVSSSTSCHQITSHASFTINETVKTSTANRPSGTYALDFVVESYSTSNFGNCGGTTTFVQGDDTLNMTLNAAAIAVVSGYGQSTTNGTSFGSPLSALVSDGNGNPVVGTVVTFTAPTNGASGTFLALKNGGTCVAVGTPGALAVATCTAVTNSTGFASSLTFTANTTTGTYAVLASTPGASPNSVSFEEENQ